MCAAAATSWDDRFAEEIAQQCEAAEASVLLARFGDAFPEGYKEQVTPVEAVTDARCLADLDGSDTMSRAHLVEALSYRVRGQMQSQAA